MPFEKYVAGIERHLENADCTVDAEKKKLELTFARMLLARLRHECAQVPEAEMVRSTRKPTNYSRAACPRMPTKKWPEHEPAMITFSRARAAGLSRAAVPRGMQSGEPGLPRIAAATAVPQTSPRQPALCWRCATAGLQCAAGLRLCAEDVL
jgi:hypothetical protein